MYELWCRFSYFRADFVHLSPISSYFSPSLPSSSCSTLSIHPSMLPSAFPSFCCSHLMLTCICVRACIYAADKTEVLEEHKAALRSRNSQKARPILLQTIDNGVKLKVILLLVSMRVPTSNVLSYPCIMLWRFLKRRAHPAANIGQIRVETSFFSLIPYLLAFCENLTSQIQHGTVYVSIDSFFSGDYGATIVLFNAVYPETVWCEIRWFLCEDLFAVTVLFRPTNALFRFES